MGLTGFPGDQSMGSVSGIRRQNSKASRSDEIATGYYQPELILANGEAVAGGDRVSIANIEGVASLTE